MSAGCMALRHIDSSTQQTVTEFDNRLQVQVWWAWHADDHLLHTHLTWPQQAILLFSG